MSWKSWKLPAVIVVAAMSTLTLGPVSAWASTHHAKSSAKSKTTTASTSGLPGLPPQFGKPLDTPHLQPGSNPSVLPGPLLIADRKNSRLLVVNPKGQILWQFPQPGDLAPGQTFLIPDDAFFTPDGKYIIATEEDDFVISVISIAQHKIVYRYGTPGVEGMGPNQLWNPDDAMMLPDGYILSPDIKNCRILLLKPGDPSPAHIYGLSTNSCLHNPPVRFGSPNGAFPMTNGHFAVTEINGDWVDEMSLNGTIYQSFHAPGIAYPSDTNEVRPGVFLTADYSNPGTVEEFTSSGQVLWRYSPTGAAALNQPSLALPLPNGDVVLNDDKNNRVIVVDPKTNQVVWQYGSGVAGTAPGQLYNPDGIDLAPPYSLLVTHAATIGQVAKNTPLTTLASSVPTLAPPPAVPALRLVTKGTLPSGVQRASAVVAGKNLMVVGGLGASGTSTSATYQLSLVNKKLEVSAGATLAQSTHDAGAGYLHGKVIVYGGGQSASVSTVQSISKSSSSVVGSLPQPRSDLAIAQGSTTDYVLGGYDGLAMDPSVLATTNGTTFRSVGTLTQPVRYGASVLYQGTLYVFGGESAGQATTTIQSINPTTGLSMVVGEFNAPIQGAAAAVLHGSIYIFGGTNANGSPSSLIYRYDPTTAMLSVAGQLPQALSNVAVAQWGNDIAVVGGAGVNSTLSKNVYLFTQVPVSKTLTVSHHKSHNKS